MKVMRKMPSTLSIEKGGRYYKNQSVDVTKKKGMKGYTTE